MSSSPESRLKPDHEIQLSGAASGVHPAEPESAQGANTYAPSRAELLLAAEKRMLEMMARLNAAPLSSSSNPIISSHAGQLSTAMNAGKEKHAFEGKNSREGKHGTDIGAACSEGLSRKLKNRSE